MRYRACAFFPSAFLVCLLLTAMTTAAQDADSLLPPPHGETDSAMRHDRFTRPRRFPRGPMARRPVRFHITSRLFERSGPADNWRVSWTDDRTKDTLPGQPVKLKIGGRNLVIIVRFTPYLRHDRGTLVAQTRVYLEDEAGNVRTESTLNAIPLRFGEKIYYFPLGGRESGANAYIEICLEFF